MLLLPNTPELEPLLDQVVLKVENILIIVIIFDGILYILINLDIVRLYVEAEHAGDVEEITRLL
jgi:hypothetical protein